MEKPEDLMKYPYVLEFLGLKEEAAYSETDLETAIINRIEHFLLELGKGFLFEARQKRFTFRVAVTKRLEKQSVPQGRRKPHVLIRDSAPDGTLVSKSAVAVQLPPKHSSPWPTGLCL